VLQDLRGLQAGGAAVEQGQQQRTELGAGEMGIEPIDKTGHAEGGLYFSNEGVHGV
jgi:hypothetical protein